MNAPDHDPAWLEGVVDEREASKLVGLAPATLATLRTRGGGPPYLKIMRAVRYRRRDLLSWVSEKVRISTSDDGRAA